jgi:hypothetical protein
MAFPILTTLMTSRYVRLTRVVLAADPEAKGAVSPRRSQFTMDSGMRFSSTSISEMPCSVLEYMAPVVMSKLRGS